MNIQLASKIDCTGCMACQGACKHNAIRIVKDDNGFVYPSIDESICKQCGACMQKCPILNYDKLKFRDPQKCYAAKIKNEDLTKGCTSGGVATALSLRTIQNGGVVYGAAFVPHYGVKHIRVDDEGDLEKLKGSKYVESHITSEIYQSIRADLKSGKKVLFIGTPCQVAAVEQLSDSESLKTVSFICGGGVSQDYLFSHLQGYGVNKEEVTNVVFRKGRNYCIEVWNGDEKIFYQEQKDNLYLKAFDYEQYTVRASCLRCQFCKHERVGWLTIGDFWGIEQAQCSIREEKDLSCVITHDEKGISWFTSLEGLLYEEVKFEDVAHVNVCLNGHRARFKWKFNERCMRAMYPVLGFNKSVKLVKRIIMTYRLPERIVNFINRKLSKYKNGK